jgi:hypothetical protein
MTLTNNIKDFILFCDKDGDACDVTSSNLSIDHIFQILNYLDTQNKSDAPHTAWEWKGEKFLQVKDC